METYKKRIVNVSILLNMIIKKNQKNKVQLTNMSIYVYTYI